MVVSTKTIYVVGDVEFYFSNQAEKYDEILSQNKYNKEQLLIIIDGIKGNYNISFYLNPEFTEEQMNQIYLGLKNDIDVSLYAKTEYDDLQMAQIRYGLQKKP